MLLLKSVFFFSTIIKSHSFLPLSFKLACFSSFTTNIVKTYALNSRQSSSNTMEISYINSSVAKAIDETLMSSLSSSQTSPGGYSLDQLMELAGYSCACAVYDYWNSFLLTESVQNREILLFCGPGNNGGDGLVAARHLFMFGFKPTIVLPSLTTSLTKDPFRQLLKQCQDLNIPILSEISEDYKSFLSKYILIVDAFFGFSFKGPSREPYTSYIQAMIETSVPTLSIDIPSGWDVDEGDKFQTNFLPSSVVSLTVPKLCMRGYKGVHYVGGRFVPPVVAEIFSLKLPQYAGVDQIVRLSSPSSEINQFSSEL